MIKLFVQKPIINRVEVLSMANKKMEAELSQAKGVMNNFLKDKHFKVKIGDSTIVSQDYLDVTGFADSGKAMRKLVVNKNNDTPLLRKVYLAIEKIAEEFSLNKV